MTSGIAGYKGGRIDIEALNEAARQTCAWETTCQTEEE